MSNDLTLANGEGADMYLAQSAGGSEPILLNESIGKCFERTVEKYGHCTAIKNEKRCLTYSDLGRQSDALAIALRKLGINSGDRVAVTLGMTIDNVVVIFACFKLGAILAPMNPSYSPQEVTSAIKKVTAKCYILSTHITLPHKEPHSTSALLETVLKSCSPSTGRTSSAQLENVITVEDDANPWMQPWDAANIWSFGALLDKYDGQRLVGIDHVKPDDIATLLFTSGTTSSPKAVKLTHSSILNNAYVLGSEFSWNLTNRDVIAGTMPLYHAAGLIPAVLAPMIYGSSVTFPCESFDPYRALAAIKEDRCSIVTGVPTMFHAWLDLLDRPEFINHDFSHIRTGFIAAAPIVPSLRRKMNERLHAHNVGNGYGMTELAAFMSIVKPTDPPGQKMHSVGQVIPHQLLRITARDDPHRVLPVGEKGEIQASGMGIMKGYWEDSAKTAEALVEETGPRGTIRWMRTGDEGMMDRKGYLTITGRIKDIIIRGGENIYPPIVEEALMQCPGVKTACVVGLPDEVYGEVVAAFVIPCQYTWTFPGLEGDKGAIDLRPRTHIYQGKNGFKRKLSDVDSGEEDIASDRTEKKRRDSTMTDQDIDFEDNEDRFLVQSEELALSAGLLREWVRARLNKQVVPKFVFWTTTLPMTPTGKIEKYKLREIGREALGCKEE